MLALAVAGVAVAVGASNLVSQARAGQPAAQVADATLGRDLFLANCASCHGAHGEGTAAAPNIKAAGAALADYVLRTGRMPLPAPNAPSERRPVIFTDEQIRDARCVRRVVRLGTADPRGRGVGRRPLPGTEPLHRELRRLPRRNGRGGAVGGGFVAPSLHQSDPLTVAEAVTVGPGPMPRFSFGQDQLNALAAYVQFLRTQPSPGGLPIAQVGPVPEGFIAGFVGLGLIMVLVQWIGRRRRRRAG